MRKSILEADFNKAWGELLFQMKVYPFKTDGEGQYQLIPIDEEYSFYRDDTPSYAVNRNIAIHLANYGHLCLLEYPNYDLFKQIYLSAKIGF